MAGEVGIDLPKRRIGHSIIHARLELGPRLIGWCIILGLLEIILRKLGFILWLLCILRRERRLRLLSGFQVLLAIVEVVIIQLVIVQLALGIQARFGIRRDVALALNRHILFQHGCAGLLALVGCRLVRGRLRLWSLRSCSVLGRRLS